MDSKQRPRPSRILTDPPASLQTAQQKSSGVSSIVTPPQSPQVPSSHTGDGKYEPSASCDLIRYHRDVSSGATSLSTPSPPGPEETRVEIRKDQLLGSGRFSDVYVAAYSPARNSAGADSITPPTTPVRAARQRTLTDTSPLLAIKLPIDRLASAVLNHESSILTYLTERRNSKSHIVHFHGVDQRTGGIILGYAPCNLETFGSTIYANLDERAAISAIAHHTPGLIESLASSLSWLHQSGIIHADIKPANILLVPSGSFDTTTAPIDLRDSSFTPLLADFSSSFHASAERMPSIAGAAAGGGSTDYLAPELLHRPVMEPTFSTDVHALAVTILAWIIGGSPYASAANRYARMEMAKQGRPLDFVRNDPPAEARLEGVAGSIGDFDLVAVIEAGLRRDPGKRSLHIDGL